MSDNVVVIGAGSGIARALCQRLAARKCRLVLAGRNVEDLSALAADLRIRHEAAVDVERFDALEFGSQSEFADRCRELCQGRIDVVVVCYGLLPEPAGAAASPESIQRTIDVNFTSVALLLEKFATMMESQRGGCLAAISSVAGDRGRQSNYIYGAAKAGLSTFLDGLRNRMFRVGVHVLSIKPGFVDTPMTLGKINPRSPLVASPDRVARDIDRALLRRENVLYTPWFWWPIMKVIGLIPEPIFKRLGL
jgi:NAD(P)-dependent dehydrogenase (short-subunit alcohol dehydrogenase family)